MTMLSNLNFEFTDISKCQKSWDFGPVHKLPEKLPSWALGGFLLSGFDLEPTHPVQNVTNASPSQAAELFFSLYPKLSWPEIVRLTHQPDLEKSLDCDLLLIKYGIKSDERLLQISHFLLMWPQPVQQFLSEKDIRAFDVGMVAQLPIDVQINILYLLVSLKPSKTLFCQMFELAGDLFLMGIPLNDITESLATVKPLEELRKKRYPQTTQNDLKFSNTLQTLPWPKLVSAHSVRKGDLHGVEVKFFVKDATELEKTILGLQTVVSTWKQKNESDPAL